jgi:poly [ADP-ribose] polymerase
MMDKQMKQIGYDSTKMPLGKLSKDTILKGYKALNKLME